MGPDVFDDFSQCGKFRVLRIRCCQIAGNRRHADNLSARIVQRHFGGQIPTQRAIAVGHEFEVVVDFAARFEDLAILFPIDPGEVLGKKILSRFPSNRRGSASPRRAANAWLAA